jgi:tripartite-type tricarboxylate transporter receptor subunit TctC
MHRPHPLSSLALACGLLSVVTCAPAADKYPTKPVRMIVASSPGTSSDIFARTIAQTLSEQYGVQVVVDNRVGAGGLIGNQLLSKAAPDGYTWGVVGATRIVSALLRTDPPYDPIKDSAPVMQITSVPNVIAASGTLPVKSVQELIALAKAKPHTLNYSSVGFGSSSHLAAEIFAQAAGIDVVHVPFKSVADSYSETISGTIHFFVYALPSALPMLKDGRLRPLAVTAAKRNPALPDVPAVTEVGLSKARFDNWNGVVLPGGTSRALVSSLAHDVQKVLQNPDTQQKITRQGAEATVDSTPAQFTNLFKSEYQRYKEVIRRMQPAQ